MTKFHKYLILSTILFLLVISFVSASKVTRYVDNIAQVRDGNISYKINDRLGNQRIIINEEGGKESEYKSLPYGQTITDNGSKYGFTGKEKDASSGLNYFGARYYDSDAGRFVSVDPLGDGANHYVYVSNNPMNYIDPTGRKMLLLPTSTNEENIDFKLMKPENTEEIINNLNSFFEEELFYMNKEGYVEPTKTYSSGTDDQKLLYGIIMDVISNQETIKISINKQDNSAQFAVIEENDQGYVLVGNIESNYDSFNYGENTDNIGLNTGFALIHELGHARGYLLTPDKSNSFTYGETIAVTAENIARRIKQVDERKYYSTSTPNGIEMIDGKYIIKIYGLTPYEYDKEKKPTFIKSKDVFQFLEKE